MKKIAITGCSGYIGTHIVKYFLALGEYEIHGCDIQEFPFEDFREEDRSRIHFVQLNLCNKNKTLEYFLVVNPDFVFHLAADIDVGESTKDSLKYYENNLLSTINLLAAFKNNKEVLGFLNNMDSLIFASTAAVYGTPAYGKQEPLNELDPTNPESPYGHSKLMCEQMIADTSRNLHFNYIIFRFFNVCGGVEKRCMHLLPIIMNKIKNNEPVHIFGDDYPTRDGTCIRDYIYVRDISLGFKLAINYIEGKGERVREIINLGSESGDSVKEIIYIFSKYLPDNEKISIIIDPRRPGDPAYLVASNEKAKKLLGWEPQYDSERIIGDVIIENIFLK